MSREWSLYYYIDVGYLAGVLIQFMSYFSMSIWISYTMFMMVLLSEVGGLVG